MRKLAAVIAVVSVPILLAGCSSGPGSVSKSDVETKMSGLFHDRSHEDAKSVVCDGDLKAEVDATQKCTVTSADGQTWMTTAKVTKVDGDTASYDIEFSDKFVSPDDIAGNVAKFYTEKVGTAPKSTSCNGLLRGATGATVRCVITESDSTRWGVTVTTTNVEGDTVNYDILVDDQPMG
ncbi:DUF4333 domain-containing protein [Nocardia sp. SYP-A9097]|uniref:DUF4333 domain-containing protein n=1 Tax=Nocardia sp. SYP-A9097 TaxID=2663237 RepID=UPI00129A100E|nr:DUF4333 domain-containing protein [Nocardia sp. SYP-A9097]MRH91473.1 DUF4333 domain-containing protein [Nocardia sp. SYP-A9097]